MMIKSVQTFPRKVQSSAVLYLAVRLNATGSVRDFFCVQDEKIAKDWIDGVDDCSHLLLEIDLNSTTPAKPAVLSCPSRITVRELILSTLRNIGVTECAARINYSVREDGILLLRKLDSVTA